MPYMLTVFSPLTKHSLSNALLGLQIFLVSTFIFSPELYADCRPWAPPRSGETLPVIGNIIIDNNNVFDPADEGENTWLHRTANSLHFKTKEAVIKRQLLIEVGDIYDPLLIDESERLLRANRYIKSARIVAERICDDKIEVHVITVDSWTLTPGISFGRSGGVNTTTIELEEHNVFGYGKAVSFDSENNNERTQNKLQYTDNNLLGSRNVLHLELQDNSDGEAFGLSTGLPFFQFASDHAWNVSIETAIQENAIYDQGVVTGRIGRDKNSFNSYYAWANLASLKSVNRYRAGWSYIDDASFLSEEFPLMPIPEDTVYSSPFLGWQHSKQHYIKAYNLFGVAVTEDISIGYNADIQIGWINENWGSTDNFLTLAGSYARGYQPDDKQLVLWQLNLDGLMGNSTTKDGKIKAIGNWFLFHNSQSRLHIHGIVELGKHLSIDNQISIGGDSGLRGYPLKYQNGDRKFLFSLEERYFFDWYPMHVVKTGISGFADIGSAWDSKTESRHSLRDIGFGFLFASTRQSTSKILRVDFAFPLDDNDSVDSFQVLVGSQIDF